uniref:Protein unc-13 homolog D-like n=1 Tax=Petromyzon marinus TaxID=7757 RepID=A0AAJ7U937_PETMA|nr:protein unc-13 homolog D-like [Petromyzon marinus]
MGFLSLYTSQSDVSPFQQSITVWLKYARMHGCGRRVEFRILEAALLDMEKDWDAQKAYERAVELLDSVQHFVGQSLRMLEDLLSSFPPDNPASTDRLTYLLRCVCFVYKSRVCQPQHLPCSDARAAITAALKRGIEDRYLNLKQSMQNVAEDLVRMLTLAKEVVGAVRSLSEKYSEVFASTCDVPLALIMHQQAGDLLGPDVRATMRGVSDALGTGGTTGGTAPSAHTAETTLRLYLVVLTLRTDTERLRGAGAPAAVEVAGPSAAPGALDALHEWFSGVFWSWFHVMGSKVSSVMDQAVEADTLTPEMAGAKHSSSAVDSAKCFQDYCELWQQLRWPHPTKTQSKIVDGISKSAIGYAQLVSRKLAGLGCPEAAAVAAGGGGGGGGGGGLRRRSIMAGPVALALTAEAVTTLARQYCIGVNNVELVWASLSALPEQWSWSGLSEAEVETARRMLRAQLHDTEGRLDGPIGDVLRRLREMILAVTRTNLLAVGASNISSSHQAIESLSDFLNKTIRVLFETLSNDRFQRLLEELWTSTVLMLVEIVSEKKPRSIDFYSRMDLAAQALLDIYNPSDRGHAPVSLELKEFVELDRELKLKMTQTAGLVVQILQRRCSEQTSSLQRRSFGSLALKCLYDHGRQLLVVEVLNVALPGGDDKGQIRPIVKIRLLPRSTFGDVKARSTRAGERGTHILVDETLSFKVSREQCASPGACALCTVRNHGGLRAALVGEAALALSGVPGVHGPPAPDPRSVPQVALALLHPRPSDAEAEILAVLLGRASDSEAQEFAKAYRAAESQCLHPATSP